MLASGPATSYSVPMSNTRSRAFVMGIAIGLVSVACGGSTRTEDDPEDSAVAAPPEEDAGPEVPNDEDIFASEQAWPDAGPCEDGTVSECPGPGGCAGLAVCQAGARSSCSCDLDADGSENVLDCAPTDPGIHPGAAESCNGIDDNCNLEIDEGLTSACYDGPEGTLGVGACAEGTTQCAEGAWEECVGQVVPEPEICDGSDNDCDGAVDQALETGCYEGAPETAGVGACAPGVRTCAAGVWGACVGQVLPAAEVCDGLDTSCDGQADDDLGAVCYDGPPSTAGVGLCVSGTTQCTAGSWSACSGQVLPDVELCDGADNDCNGKIDDGLAPPSCYDGPEGTQDVGPCAAGTTPCADGAWGECVDQVVPTVETCDGVDNDCDGTIDLIEMPCYTGPAGTEGKGPCQAGISTCVAGIWSACEGQVLPAEETCDNVDNDCDGAVDDALSKGCYTGPGGTSGVGACHGGTSICSVGIWSACQGQVLPSGEACDNVDNDCDGPVDEGLTKGCYTGSGGTSGVGLCHGGTATCSGGGWSSCQGQVVPAGEVCDGQDNDCDGAVDEGFVKLPSGNVDIVTGKDVDNGTGVFGGWPSGDKVCISSPTTVEVVIKTEVNGRGFNSCPSGGNSSCVAEFPDPYAAGVPANCKVQDQEQVCVMLDGVKVSPCSTDGNGANDPPKGSCATTPSKTTIPVTLGVGLHKLRVRHRCEWKAIQAGKEVCFNDHSLHVVSVRLKP